MQFQAHKADCEGCSLRSQCLRSETQKTPRLVNIQLDQTSERKMSVLERMKRKIDSAHAMAMSLLKKLDASIRGIDKARLIAKGIDRGRLARGGRSPITSHHFFPVLPLRQIVVVRGTQHLKIVWAMVPATGKGLLVVEFQPLTLPTASRLDVDESALVPIALTNRALDWRRDIPGRRRSVGVFDALPRGLRSSKTLGFEPL